MRTTRPITVSLPIDLLREAQRVAKEESRTRSALVREALQQYLASARWQRLHRWGVETAERLGIRTEEDLQRLFDKVTAGPRRDAGGNPGTGARRRCRTVRVPGDPG